MKTITIKNLINGVATFNTDPYCIENEELAQEIVNEIDAHGAQIIEDSEERVDALAKLDLSEDSNRIVYKAGSCFFALDVSAEPELDISNFSARKIGSGCYRVTYSELLTYETWTAEINDMTLIDATFRAEEIDMEEWMHLYDIVTEKGDYYNGNEDLDEDDEDE